MATAKCKYTKTDGKERKSEFLEMNSKIYKHT